MSGYGRQFAQALLLEKIAFRSMIIGVPVVLVAVETVGWLLAGLLVMVASFVAGTPLVGFFAIAGATAGLMVTHLALYSMAERDPHLETVWRMRIMPPETRHGIARNAPPVRLGRPRTRGLLGPMGRRYDP